MADPGAGQPSKNADGLIGKTIAGRYTIDGHLGKGGMAVVYRASDRSFGRTVAIKVLRTDVAKDPVATKRLVREARAAGQLHHPNIITMHDVGESNGMVYIVMEFMEGRELAELMEEQGAIGVRRALGIGRQVASALAVAHGHGIIHRDIKPENLFLLNREGGVDFVKMLDFSIAKLPTNMVTAALTRAGSVFGTPHYMAPEQVEGRIVCPQTDLYALGAVIYELIAGEPPFDGASVIDILLQHAKKPAPKLSALPALALPDGLSELVDSMLAKKESDRPASAADIEQALTRLIDQLEAAPSSPMPSAPAPERTVAVTPVSVPDGTPAGVGPSVASAESRPAPAAAAEVDSALELPSEPPPNRRPANSGTDEGTLIGYGLAAQVREAAGRMAREKAAEASADDEATCIAPGDSAVPPPPAGRAQVPGVFAPGSMPAATSQVRPVKDLTQPPPSVSPPSPATSSGADAVVTAPEVTTGDAGRLRWASQETVAIRSNQMRDLSKQLSEPRKQRSMLLWFAVPAAAFGVIAAIIAVYLLVVGQ